ncbi:acyltransferase [Akkermansiaceae bacterium]|nr:acyltransferase [Akkermansiaceae bacterium]
MKESTVVQNQIPLISNFRYRPEIDGLRAVAVVAVVLYHVGLGVPGGYIGVDVFFVISGFLITSLILRDLQNGKFTLVDFWERRVRRIIPAAVVVVLTTLAAGWILLLPSDYELLGKSGAWQSVFGANIHFWQRSGYFAGPAEELALLHTWSLAVEEQFYMFFPLGLAGLFLIPSFRRRPVLLLIFGIGLASSLLLSVLRVDAHPSGTFYLLPTRAWELLCGSGVAILPKTFLPRTRTLRTILSQAGLALIIIPCFLYDSDTTFPGLAAVPPCLGTCLIIMATTASCLKGTKDPLPFVARILSLRPVVFVGLISYSLYLWHWPLIAFTNYWELEDLWALDESPLVFRCGILAGSVVLAIISWRFVETPFRKRKLGKTRFGMFAWGGAGLATVAITSLILIFQNGFPSRFSAKVYAFDKVGAQDPRENFFIHSVDFEDARTGRLPSLGRSETAKVGVMVWGDSHARSILPAVVTAADEKDLLVLAAWHSAQPPLTDYESRRRHSLGSDGPEWCEAILESIKHRRIPRVLLAAQWSEYFSDDQEWQAHGGSAALGVGDSLLRTVRSLRQFGTEVWILREVPGHLISVPKALIMSEVLGVDLSRFTCDEKQLSKLNGPFDAMRGDLEAAGAKIMDVSPLLLDENTKQYRMEMGGVAMYYDSHHMTEQGARLMAPAVKSLFRKPVPGGGLNSPFPLENYSKQRISRFNLITRYQANY